MDITDILPLRHRPDQIVEHFVGAVGHDDRGWIEAVQFTGRLPQFLAGSARVRPQRRSVLDLSQNPSRLWAKGDRGFRWC